MIKVNANNLLNNILNKKIVVENSNYR